MIRRILDPEIQGFIETHRLDDTYQLALKYASKGKGFLNLALPQIRSWQKAKIKIPELAGIKNLVWPPPRSLEQSSSEWTAKFKASLLSGEVLADLTGGTGVDTFYLSKHFNEVFYVEKDSTLSEIAAHNFHVLNARQIRVVHSKAESFLSGTNKQFTTLFLDPDRRRNDRRVYKPEDSSPDVLALLPELLNRANKILIKFSPWLDLKVLLKSFMAVHSIYIVAVENECKEILCLIRRGSNTPKIASVNITRPDNRIQKFEYYPEEERSVAVQLAFPMKYIYEPNAAIMKSGAFKLVGWRYELKKLHRHTHLYTSDRLIEEFPGRKFSLIHQLPVKKEAVSKALPEGKANLSVRNFGITVSRLKKKLQILDGGDEYLIAVTLQNGRPALLHCQKVLDQI